MGNNTGRTIVVLVCALAVVASGRQVSHSAPSDDSTQSLQAQIDSLKPGGTLTLAQQTYSHGGVIDVRVPDVTIDGNGATLTATNDETSAVKITADGVRVTNLNVSAATGDKRWTGVNQQKIVVSGHRDKLSNISVNGSAAAGVFVDGAQDFDLENITVNGTRADGVHVTGGSVNGRIDNVKTQQTGDDAIAVVSYGNEQPSKHIDIRNVTVSGTRWGRGISVVGGQDVSIHDFAVSNTSAAGLYIATEGAPYFTDSVQSVTVDNGSITSANHDPDVVQGAVLVYSGNQGKSVRDVKVSAVTIASTAPTAERNVGVVADGGTLGAISLNGINITGSDLPAMHSEAPSDSFTTAGWTVDGKSVDANAG